MPKPSVLYENSQLTTSDMDYFDVQPAPLHPPIKDRERLSYLLRWSMTHWRSDGHGPIDLDSLLQDAAEALDRSVNAVWMNVALVQGMALLLVLAWLLR